MRFELAQTCPHFHNQHQMSERTETRSIGAPPPHIENSTTLDSGAGAHRAFVGGGREYSHTGKTMRHATAYRRDRTQHTRKNLCRSAEFNRSEERRVGKE